MKSRAAFALAVPLLIGLVPPALAEIEEILVTATKRQATNLETPASITAFSQDQLTIRQIANIMDLQVSAPNVEVGNFNGTQFVTIRGVGFSTFTHVADPTIAVHVDGVYQPRVGSLLGAYEDLASVEVLRGPQGTLYGRGATGGTVNVNTAAPTDTFEGEASVIAGNYDRLGGKGFVSGPISDQLQYRLFALYDDQQEGFEKNVLPGGRDGEATRSRAARASLRYLPTGHLTADLKLSYDKRDGSYIASAITPPQDVLWPIYTDAPFDLRPHRMALDGENRDERTDTSATLTLTWEAGDATTVRSITGLLRNEFRQIVDGDGTGVFANNQDTKFESTTWSQEVNVNTMQLDDRLDVLVGVYASDDDFDFTNELPLPFITWPLPEGTEIPGLGTVPFFLRIDFQQETRSYAAFVDSTYHLTDRLRAYGGLRWSRDERKLENQQFQVVPLCGFGLPIDRQNKSWSDVSPRVGVQFDFRDNVVGYAQFQQGFKPGGFNGNLCGDDFDQEEVNSFEIGLKARVLEDRVSLSASVFHYDYTDIQVSQITDLQVNIENASEATVYGAELELSARLTPALSVDAALALLSAEYGDYVSCDAMAFPGNCSGGVVVLENVKGNPLTRAPERTFNLGLQYSAPVANFGQLMLRADGYWSSKVYFSHFEDPNESQGAYQVFNLSAEFAPANSRLLLRAFVKNLSDEEYLIGTLAYGNTSFNQSGIWAPPRTYGAAVSFAF
ncbi:MAG: TonB-dependent receptor [Pseudomonadales bacterium]|nr:TonB-dependent receptor [Pseudomonadales bacterium]